MTSPALPRFGDDDDALKPVPASPLATPHEPRPDPKAVTSARAADKPGITAPSGAYDASAIEVLEGLEPVRMRPGMYIGGTDERALHHLFAEILDNSMDEAVAGHAKTIEVSLDADGYLTVKDDGRGMPGTLTPSTPASRRWK